jgi:hypothetical protein
VEDCGDSDNQFYEITNNQLNVVAASSLVIRGVRRRVFKIMFYTRNWILRNYIQPMQELAILNYLS